MDNGRLKWQCRRGCKELDELLSQYLKNHYLQANQEEQNQFTELLKQEDDEIQALLLNQSPDAPAPLKKLIKKIKPAY